MNNNFDSLEERDWFPEKHILQTHTRRNRNSKKVDLYLLNKLVTSDPKCKDYMGQPIHFPNIQRRNYINPA